MNVLVTGAAGFIGFHLVQKLLTEGQVFGLDALTSCHDPAQKIIRLDLLQKHDSFSFGKVDLTDLEALQAFVDASEADVVFHLAAQPAYH